MSCWASESLCLLWRGSREHFLPHPWLAFEEEALSCGGAQAEDQPPAPTSGGLALGGVGWGGGCVKALVAVTLCSLSVAWMRLSLWWWLPGSLLTD